MSDEMSRIRSALGVPTSNADTVGYAAFLAQSYWTVRHERDDATKRAQRLTRRNALLSSAAFGSGIAIGIAIGAML